MPTGHFGYIEVPITKEKPKYYQVNVINILVYSVAHTYHPDIIEIIPQTNYNTQNDTETVSSPQFSLHQIYMTNSDNP